jgi:hypothetical protein
VAGSVWDVAGMRRYAAGSRFRAAYLFAFRPLKLTRLLLAAVAFLSGAPAGALAQAHTAFTIAPVRMRAQPSEGARAVRSLARGSTVTVAACGGGWCSVSAGGRTGYVPRHLLRDRTPPAAVAAPMPAEGSGYTNSRGAHVRSPTFSRSGSAPAGASARCRDGSYSVSQSRRGTCSHHGGVGKWL